MPFQFINEHIKALREVDYLGKKLDCEQKLVVVVWLQQRHGNPKQLRQNGDLVLLGAGVGLQGERAGRASQISVHPLRLRFAERVMVSSGT